MASATLKVMALVLTFLLQLVLARVMGARWYGEITYALTWAGLLSTIVVAGLDGAAVRFVSQYDVRHIRPSIREFLDWSSRRIRSFLVLVLPAGLALGFLLEFFSPSFSLKVFLILLLGVYFQARNLLSVSVLQGLRRPVLSQLPLGVLMPTGMMAVILGFRISGVDARSEYIAVAYVLMMAVIYLWATGLVRRELWDIPPEGHGATPPSEWSEVAGQLLLMAVIGLVLSRFDILLLGWFVPADGVGIYNVSARLAELTSLALVVSNIIVAPMIARHFHHGEMAQLQHLLTMSGRIVAIVTLLGISLLAVLGHTLLGWFGAPFRHGYDILLILSAGQLINVLFGPVGNVLIMTGHSTQALRMYAMAAAIMVSVALLLIPFFGAYGAAIATATGMVIWNAVMCRYIVKNLHIDPTVLGVLRGQGE